MSEYEARINETEALLIKLLDYVGPARIDDSWATMVVLRLLEYGWTPPGGFDE